MDFHKFRHLILKISWQTSCIKTFKLAAFILIILLKIYFLRSVEDIDLYAGGFLERTIRPWNTIGPTFYRIVENQFSELKNGDRFYYENEKSPYPFTLGFKIFL